MIRNFIVSISFLFLCGGLLWMCRTHPNTEAVAVYTCPMHSDVKSEKVGSCPICKMDLVMKKSVGVSELENLIVPDSLTERIHTPLIRPQKSTKTIRIKLNGMLTYDTRSKTVLSTNVAGRIEKIRIRYNYQSISKNMPVLQIYSPELAAIQRELLFLLEKDSTQLTIVKEKLLLLGMTSRQITDLMEKKQISYNITVYSNAGGYIVEDKMPAHAITKDMILQEGQYVKAGTILFNIYNPSKKVVTCAIEPKYTPYVKVGHDMLLQPLRENEKPIKGRIGLIQPIFKQGQYFTLINIYLYNNTLSIGTLFETYFDCPSEKGWWIPKESLFYLGNKNIVFKMGNKGFFPVVVRKGMETEDSVQVLSPMDNWTIAKNAAYIVDSDAFIKVP